MSVAALRSRQRRRLEQEAASSTTAALHYDPERLAHLDIPFVPTLRQVATATSAWMVGVFALVYGLLTWIVSATGLYPGLTAGWQADIAAFGGMLVLVLGLLVVLRPRIEVPRFAPVQSRDPVRWAFLGGFGSWVIAHSTLPMLWPLQDMPGEQLAAFVALNVVEHALFGMMLASFVKTRRAALALGAGFAMSFLALWLVLRVVVGL